MDQSVGIRGGSVELVKVKWETLEGTCVGLSIGLVCSAGTPLEMLGVSLTAPPLEHDRWGR